MSKKGVLLIGVLFLVLAAGGESFFYLKNKQAESLVSPTSEAPSQSSSQTQNLTYEDEAGFSFQYPNTLGVVEIEINDPSLYSSLELSSKKFPGEKIIVKIMDTNVSTVDQWLKKNPQTGVVGSSSQITLAGMNGQQLSFNNPAKNLILVIDSGILYELEAPSGDSFWDDSFKTISSSFQFISDKSSSSGTSGGGSSVIDEGEETIE